MADDLDVGVVARRRATLSLSNRDLHDLLGLPDGVRVAFVVATGYPPRTEIVLEGAGLPPTPAAYHAGQDLAELAYSGDADPPTLPPNWIVERLVERWR